MSLLVKDIMQQKYASRLTMMVANAQIAKLLIWR